MCGENPSLNWSCGFVELLVVRGTLCTKRKEESRGLIGSAVN